MKTTIKVNQILQERDNLSKTITNYWSIIILENRMMRGSIRNYDLKKLFSEIQRMSEKRIQTKLYAQAINMGYKDMKDFPKESIYPLIYKLSELNELIVKLRKIPVVTNKRSKYDDVFKTKYIEYLIMNMSKEIVEIRMKLQEYNDNSTLIIG